MLISYLRSKLVRSAPKDLLEGVMDVIKSPPEELKKVWESLSLEDRELFKQASISVLRLTAKAIIAADRGGKMSF